MQANEYLNFRWSTTFYFTQFASLPWRMGNNIYWENSMNHAAIFKSIIMYALKQSFALKIN